MNKDSFVYKWTNLSNGKFYIGYHKGSLDDGYVSSSQNNLFWEDFNNPEMIWVREILHVGDKEECLFVEQKILKGCDLKDENVYNNARGSQIIFTDDVRLKMSNSSKKRWENISDEERKCYGSKISNSKKGIPRTKETKDKLSKQLKGKSFVELYGEERAKEIGSKISESKKGMHYHSEEYKEKLSQSMIGNNLGSHQSNETREKKRNNFLTKNPGKTKTQETKQKISNSKKGKPSIFKGKQRKKIICPYCNKEGGEGLMNRWHFENCKNK